jgi:hypothetical protein
METRTNSENATANPARTTVTAPEGHDETLLSRKQLCRRWDCSFMTIHRREAAGLLHPLRFNARMYRYKLSEILAIERGAEASTAAEHSTEA